MPTARRRRSRPTPTTPRTTGSTSSSWPRCRRTRRRRPSRRRSRPRPPPTSIRPRRSPRRSAKRWTPRPFRRAPARGGRLVTGSFELRDPSNNLVTATVTYDTPSQDRDAGPAEQPGAVDDLHRARQRRRHRSAREGRRRATRWLRTSPGRSRPPHGAAAAARAPARSGRRLSCRSRSTMATARSTVLGTKFRSDIPGYITGARFYKAPLNTGTHVATLWTSTGTALATATFAGESASGWQQVLFPTPVADRGQHDLRHLVSRAERALLRPGRLLRGRRRRQSTAACAEKRRRRAERRLRLQHDERVPDPDVPVRGLLRRRRVQHDRSAPTRRRRSSRSVNPFAGASGVLTTTERARHLQRGDECDDDQRQPTSSCARRRARSVPATVTYTAATNTATITPTASLAVLDALHRRRQGRRCQGRGRQCDGRRLHVDVHDLGAAAAAADAGPGRTGARRHDGRRIRSASTTRRSCGVKG